MSSNLKRALKLCGWSVVVLVILKSEPAVQSVVGRSYSICGPWGCGPPTSTLLVWNTFICSVIIPSAILLGMLRWGFGRSVMAVIMLSCAGWVYYDVVTWQQTARYLQGNYVAQRALFATVAFPDAPLIPGMLAGVAYWFTTTRRRPVVAEAPSTELQQQQPVQA